MSKFNQQNQIVVQSDSSKQVFDLMAQFAVHNPLKFETMKQEGDGFKNKIVQAKDAQAKRLLQ